MHSVSPMPASSQSMERNSPGPSPSRPIECSHRPCESKTRSSRVPPFANDYPAVSETHRQHESAEFFMRVVRIVPEVDDGSRIERKRSLCRGRGAVLDDEDAEAVARGASGTITVRRGASDGENDRQVPRPGSKERPAHGYWHRVSRTKRG